MTSSVRYPVFEFNSVKNITFFTKNISVKFINLFSLMKKNHDHKSDIVYALNTSKVNCVDIGIAGHRRFDNVSANFLMLQSCCRALTSAPELCLISSIAPYQILNVRKSAKSCTLVFYKWGVACFVCLCISKHLCSI